MIVPQLGYCAPGLQRFHGIDTDLIGGTLGVLINGAAAAQTATMDASNGYTGYITASVPNNGYTWQLTVNGVTRTPVMTAPRIPQAGEDYRAVIWGDAAGANSAAGAGQPPGFYYMAREGQQFSVCLGDWLYTVAATDLGTSADSYRTIIRREILQGLGRREFMAAAPQITQWDNHDALGVTNKAHYEGVNAAIYAAAYQACFDFYLGLNPRNTDSGIHTMQTLYGQSAQCPYYRTTVGDVEYLMLDQVSFADDRTNPVPGNRKPSMGFATDSQGATKQKDWAVARINASTTPVLIICAPLQPEEDTVAGNTEWDAIFRACDVKNQTIIIVSANSHCLWVGYRDATNTPSRAATWFTQRGITEIQATPVQGTVWSGGDMLGNGALVYANEVSATQNTPLYGSNFNYLVMDRKPSLARTEFSIRSAWDGSTKLQFYIPDGGRQPVVMSRSVGLI